MKKYYLLIVVLCLIIIGEGVVIFLNSNQEVKPKESYTNIPKEEENVEDQENNSEFDSSKVLVYDALYDLSTDEESYCVTMDYNTMNCLEMAYAIDLIVPYININSDDAKIANQEIYELYEELINIFNENSDYGVWFTDVEYSYYINDNILSVVITTSSGGTDVIAYQYYTYNFDLNTGNFADYSEVYSLAGFTSDNIDSSVAEAITSVMEVSLDGFKDPLTETGDGGYFPTGTNFDTFNNGSIDNYITSVQNGTLKYFLDEEANLNVIVTLLIPAGRGEFDTVITVS